MTQQDPIQGRYQLGQVLGRGGMGVVYRAFDNLIRRDVAIKTLSDIQDKAALDLFYKEWGVLASLVHPNVVQVYDVGEFRDGETIVPFFVMPLLPGQTLSKLISESSGRLTTAGAVDIICQAARGLQAAHEQGLVHRDIKPSNILVMDDGSVKLIDFGIAHIVDTHSVTGLKGTPAYMAPEQIRLERLSPQTDIYSLGVVLFEALTRRKPFQGAADRDIAAAILHEAPPAVSDLNPYVSEPLSRVLHKAMAKQPWHRFATAREFGETLQKALRGEPIEIFNEDRIRQRLERAQRTFESGEYTLASEIVAELEAEGYLDAKVMSLRRNLHTVLKKERSRRLLEEAQRCFEEHEYELSLRKVQEALDLDAANTDVLSLKARIEQASQTHRSSEWLLLARRHLDNAAFDHARQALQNVLEAEPHNAQAKQLFADVGRREKEYAQTRSRKAALHQQALQAWEAGEVSLALSKLERLLDLDHRDPDPGIERDAYQSFYQQVRSEHDSIKKAHEQARALLGRGDFGKALEICGEFLRKYPSHALFRALKLDGEDRQRRSLSAYIAEVDRRLAEESDPDKRVSLVEEACQCYPQEPHFQKTLQHIRQRRELIQSIAAKARQCEDAGQFDEAIEQWRILQNIEGSYPGLQIEMERLATRREKRGQTEAKTEWVRRIDWHLSADDHPQALGACSQALREFPEDPELTHLESLAQRASERVAGSLDLLAQGRLLLERNDLESGVAKLREGLTANPSNTALRSTLAEALLQQARQRFESDWRTAESLVEEALGLQPDSALGRSLRTLVEDRKREDAVSWCLGKARHLQAEQKTEEAYQLVERVAVTYPGEARLEQFRESLRRALSAGQAGQRRQEESEDAEAAFDASKLLSGPPKIPDAAAESTPAGAAPAPKSNPSKSASRNASVVAKGVWINAVVLAKGWKHWALCNSRLLGSVAIVCIIAALTFAGAHFFLRSPPVAPAPVLATLNLTTDPVGASVRLIGDETSFECETPNCQLSVAAGTYRVETTLAGYHSATRSVSLTAGSATPLPIALAPLPALLRVIADLDRGTVSVNGEPAGQLDGGLFEVELDPGVHTIEIKSGRLTASLTADVGAGRAPRISDPPVVHELRAYVIAGFAEFGELRSSSPPSAVHLDGLQVESTADGPMTLSGLSPGIHEIIFSNGERQRRHSLEIGPQPLLTAILETDRNLGTVIVETGVDGAVVTIDNGRYRKTVEQRGRLRFALPPGTYQAQATKTGFLPTAPQMFTVGKGVEGRLTFKLEAEPQMASLALAGAPTGAEVWIDGKRVGIVSAGGFTAGVPAGKHRIELRNLPEMYAPQPRDLSFEAGSSVTLSGQDLPLLLVKGEIVIHVEPPDADVRLVIKTSGGAEQEVRSRKLYKEAGRYVVSAVAPGYQKTEDPGDVVAGKTTIFRLVLTREASTPAVVRFGLEELSRIEGCERLDELMVCKGDDFVLLPAAPPASKYTFTARHVPQKRGPLNRLRGLFGKSRIQWVAGYRDENNYLLFQLDDKSLYETQVVDGKRSKPTKVADHNCPKAEYYSLSVEISPETITHSILRDGSWHVLGQSKVPGNLTNAGFGFFTPDESSLAISHFEGPPKGTP